MLIGIWKLPIISLFGVLPHSLDPSVYIICMSFNTSLNSFPHVGQLVDFTSITVRAIWGPGRARYL